MQDGNTHPPTPQCSAHAKPETLPSRSREHCSYCSAGTQISAPAKQGTLLCCSWEHCSYTTAHPSNRHEAVFSTACAWHVITNWPCDVTQMKYRSEAAKGSNSWALDACASAAQGLALIYWEHVPA